MRNASDNREYSEDAFCIDLRFGGPLAGRSVVKSCLALAYKVGLNIDDCEHAKNYLLSDGNACFGYFNEKDVVINRPQNTFFHCVYVCGDPKNKQVLAYAEYFGYQRIVVCLSSNYVGKKFSHVYAIDLVTGKELDIEINLEIGPEEIPDIYAYKKVDWNVTKRALEALLAVWKEKDEKPGNFRSCRGSLGVRVFKVRCNAWGSPYRCKGSGSVSCCFGIPRNVYKSP